MNRKWIAVNEVNEWYQPAQGPFFDHRFSVFPERLKNMLDDLPRFHALVLTHIELFWMCDVRVRMRETLVQVYLSALPDGKKCFAPLPRTVYLAIN